MILLQNIRYKTGCKNNDNKKYDNSRDENVR